MRFPSTFPPPFFVEYYEHGHDETFSPYCRFPAGKFHGVKAGYGPET